MWDGETLKSAKWGWWIVVWTALSVVLYNDVLVWVGCSGQWWRARELRVMTAVGNPKSMGWKEKQERNNNMIKCTVI